MKNACLFYSYLLSSLPLCLCTASVCCLAINLACKSTVEESVFLKDCAQPRHSSSPCCRWAPLCMKVMDPATHKTLQLPSFKYRTACAIGRSLLTPPLAPLIHQVYHAGSCCCFAGCSPNRANMWFFRRQQIPPTVPLGDYAGLCMANTSFLWDISVIQRHWNSNKAFLFKNNPVANGYIWEHSRDVKYTIRSLRHCCPGGTGNRSVLLTFCFWWGLFFAMFLDIQPTLPCSLPSSGCLGQQPHHKQLFAAPPPRSFAALQALKFSATNNLWTCVFTNVKSKP